MKLAVLSESPTDEAVIFILFEGLIGRPVELVSPGIRTRSGGVGSIRSLILPAIKKLTYGTDVDVLAIVVDSDDSPSHFQAHEEAGWTAPGCRLCQIKSIANDTISETRRPPDIDSIKIVAGMASPSLEAWLRCGLDPSVNEAAWNRKLDGEKLTFDRLSLKRDVYGTTRPSLDHARKCAIDAAERLLLDLDTLESLFPGGFGAFARSIRQL